MGQLIRKCFLFLGASVATAVLANTKSSSICSNSWHATARYLRMCIELSASYEKLADMKEQFLRDGKAKPA